VLRDFRQGDNPFHSYGAVLTIPLSNRAARNNYRAGKAEKEQAILRYKNQEEEILREINDAIVAARTSLQRVSATAAAREYAEQALQAEQILMESGKSTSYQVLQLQRDLTARRSDEIRALADYNRALSEVARAEGTILERNNVQITLK
jgi:outer membrane protein TolC